MSAPSVFGNEDIPMPDIVFKAPNNEKDNEKQQMKETNIIKDKKLMEYIKEEFHDRNKVIEWKMANETLRMDILDYISERKVKNRKKIITDKIQEERKDKFCIRELEEDWRLWIITILNQM